MEEEIQGETNSARSPHSSLLILALTLPHRCTLLFQNLVCVCNLAFRDSPNQSDKTDPIAQCPSAKFGRISLRDAVEERQWLCKWPLKTPDPEYPVVP